VTLPDDVQAGVARRARGSARLAGLLASLTFVSTLLTGSLNFSEGGGRAFQALVNGAAGDERAFSLLAFVLLAGIPYAAGVMLFLAAHEMGHYLACRYYGVPCTPPYFIPAPVVFLFGTLGAVIRIKGAIPDRRVLFDIGVAGPLAGFPVALGFTWWGLVTAETAGPAPDGGFIVFGDSLLTRLVTLLVHGDAGAELLANGAFMAGWFGLLATTMNLIPAGQLDGGHIVFAVLPRWHRAASLAAALFLIALVVSRWAFHGEYSAWMLWAVILLVLGRRHPPVVRGRPGLGKGRFIVALAAAAVLVVSFMPHPIAIFD